MKKFFVFVLLSAMVLSLAGCGKDSKTSGDSKDLLQKIKDKGEIVIGMNPDYPPFEFIKMENGKDEIVGFEVMVADEIGKKLGVKVTFKTMDFDGVIPAVQAGQVDIAMSGITPTDERKKVVDFSEDLYSGKQTYIVHKDNADQYKTTDDLKGKVVGAQMGSIQYELAKTVGAKDVKQLKDVGALVMEVANKNMDAIIIAELTAEQYCKTQPDVVMAPVQFDTFAEGVAVAMPKGSDSLKKEIDDVINELKEQGKLEQMFIDAESLVTE